MSPDTTPRDPTTVGKTKPPESFPLTDNATEYIGKRLVTNPWSTPAPIRSTSLGLLFSFANSSYWQERRWECNRDKHRSWSCPDHSIMPSEPYTADINNLEDRTLYIVEGVFDALTLYNMHLSSVAVLTSMPRVDQLQGRQFLYDNAIWIPDGDMNNSLQHIKLGLNAIRLVWPDAVGITLPEGEDPSSMDKQQLMNLIKGVSNGS